MTPKEKAAGVLDTPATAITKLNTGTVAPAQSFSKRFATLQAKCALAGVSLHQMENDHGDTVFIVSRWALTRELPDLDANYALRYRITGLTHGGFFPRSSPRAGELL